MNKSPFWSFIEELEDFGAPLADWKNTQHGEHDIDAFRHTFLSPTDQYAQTMRCPTKCDRPCPMRVQHKEKCIEAVCGENLSGNHSLSEHDILIYKVSMNKLHRIIAETFGFELAEQPLSSERRYLLGTYTPYAGVGYPVYMAYCNFIYGMSGMVKELCAEIPGGFILLATSCRHLTPKAEELLDKHGAVFVSLEDELLIDRQCQVTLRRGHAEIFASLLDENSGSGASFFPTPPGTRWEDVSIYFKDNHTVEARIGNIRKTLDFALLGMSKTNSKEPLASWDFLRKLANVRGKFTRNDGSAKTAKFYINRKYELSISLKKFFRIEEGEPIDLAFDNKTYICRFNLYPEGYDRGAEIPSR